MNTTPQLPPAPIGLTLGWVDREQAREDLATRRVAAVLKNDTEIWTLKGNARLVDEYASTAKRRCGWTVIQHVRGLS